MTTSSGRILVTPRSLEGVSVQGNDGRKVGEVSTVVIDETDGQVLYALLGHRGVLGIGDKFTPVPWSCLRYDPVRGDYLANFDRAVFEDAPSYDSEQLGKDAYGWVDQVARHFGRDRALGRDEPPEIVGSRPH